MTAPVRGAGAVLAGALTVALAAVAAGTSASAPAPARIDLATYFKDGPPARVTGGFGEDSCFACHFDGTKNDGKGELSVAGLPARYAPGETYRLEVGVTRPGMAAAGFQLAVRSEGDGTQAGSLAAPPEETGRVTIVTERDVQFAQHLLEGIELPAADTGRWTVTWTAPDAGGRVLVHVAAIAGDGDDSQMGDHVYTLELASKPNGR